MGFGIVEEKDGKKVVTNLAGNPEEKDIYSTEEVKTNKVWIDGKPIYRKVFTQDGFGAIDVSSLNIDICFLNNSMTVLVRDMFCTAPYTTSALDYWNLYYQKSNKTVVTRGEGQSGLQKIYVVIEYTKTN